MSNANIFLTGGCNLQNLLVIRLDNSPYFVQVSGEHNVMTNTHLLSMVPTLWQWLKLWWKYRGNRKTQHSLACFIKGT